MIIKVNVERYEKHGIVIYSGISQIITQTMEGEVSASGGTLDDLKVNLKQAIESHIAMGSIFQPDPEIYKKLMKDFELELDVK
jgi:hypothetical protein